MQSQEDSGKSVLLRVSAAGYYAGSSILVQFMNKALFTTFQFQFPLIVALAQMMTMVPVCYIVAKPKIDWATAKTVFPLALVNTLNVVFGLVGTADLNVPMFIALRRFTLLCTVILERSMLHKQHDRATMGAVGLMIGVQPSAAVAAVGIDSSAGVFTNISSLALFLMLGCNPPNLGVSVIGMTRLMLAGAVVAAATDLTFSMYGYAAVFINNFLTALYLIMVKSSPATSGLTTTGLLGYNAALSLPMLATALLLSREPSRMRLYPGFRWPGFQVSMGCSCILGLAVSHSTFVCTRVNDPLMTSTAGNLKNVVMTVIGAFAFGDFQFSLWNSIGLLMSMIGAIWYAARSALKARRRLMKESLLPSRDPEKGPLIGRDRSVALRRTESPSLTPQPSLDPHARLELPAIRPAGKT